MEIELSHFDGFIHLFAAANLAYAGSENFKAAVDTKVINVSDAITPIIERGINNLKDKLIVYNTEEYIKKRVDNLHADFKSKLELANAESNSGVQFLNGFKSMFFLSALFCISFLIVAGFQQFFHEADTTTYDTLFLLNLAALFNVFVFIRAFTKFKDRTLKAIYPLLSMGVIGIVIFWYCDKYNLPEYCKKNCGIKLTVYLSLLVAASPYILHTIRILIHKGTWQFRIILLAWQTRRKLLKVSDFVEEQFNMKNESGEK